ncbi:MAG: pyridoxal phosphate-dependent aminotransferase [Bryobacteraceae bacterium]
MRLSERLGSIKLSSTAKAAAAAERLRRQGADVVDLGVGEPDFPTPDNAKRAAVEAIERNFTRYTAIGGIPELREAVCRRHATDFGSQYAPEECMISVGGKHVIFNAIQSLIDPGDEAVIPVPFWMTYRDVVEYAGGQPVYVQTRESDGFRVTAAMIEVALTPRTRLVIVNSPSNPTGAVVERTEFEAILDLAHARGIWVLSDESYARFLYDTPLYSAGSHEAAHENLIISGSVSKTYAMTGWRIGYGLGPEPLIRAMTRLQSHTTTSPTSVAQAAALEALSGPQDSVAGMLSEYRARREYVLSRLGAMPGIAIRPPQGAFYVYPNVSEVMKQKACVTASEFASRLLEQELLAVVPGDAFGTSEHIRISYAASRAQLERGMDRLEKFVRGAS